MNKNKHLLLSIIGIAILVIAVVGVTYAFFTYSKTGSENAIRTGDIYFNSTETGNIVTLTNVFPVASSTIGTANESATDVSTVAITIEGNTTYNGGVEYVLTLDDVHTETNTNPAKKIPLSLNVSVESITDQTTSTTTSIGTANNDYFTARGTTANPSSTAIYKVLAGTTAEQDEQILVGYVPKNVTVKGKVVVKAYIDDAKVLITDTPDAVDTTGKTVISTTEWNSIKGNSALSFKVKVEARDGIWVEEPIVIPTMAEMCPNCKFMFTTTEYYYGENGTQISSIPAEIIKESYTDIINESRKVFLGFTESDGKIDRAFACGLKDETIPFCVEGTTNGTSYSHNLSLLQGPAFWNNGCVNVEENIMNCQGQVSVLFFPTGTVSTKSNNSNPSCSVTNYNNSIQCIQ